MAPDADIETTSALRLRFDADGLVPAVASEADTGALLMLAYMNAEAVRLTLETGQAHYFSRSRQAIWLKGATSGQIQSVVEMRVDCDQDAVWLRVKVQGDGGACHTGARSCFYRKVVDGALVRDE